MSNSVFAETKYFIIDMDGTFYLDGNIIPGSVDFLNTVKATEREYYFFTNNSSRDLAAYIDKLHGMGIDIDKKQMMVSTHVILRWLKNIMTAGVCMW